MATRLSNCLNKDMALSGPCAPSGSSIAAPPRMHVDACLLARIAWCHRQAMKALTTREVEEWCAEKKGLIDALLKRDCTQDYQDRPGLLQRYTMGRQDGGTLIQAAKVRPSCPHRYN